VLVNKYKMFDLDKILEITNDVQNKSNKDLLLAIETLSTEFEKTKELIIDLTRHLDLVEEMYNTVNNEMGKRIRK
jgi:hypothetical protein